MAESPTGGMINEGNNTYSGTVGIKLNEQEINDTDYEGFTPSLDIIQDAKDLVSVGSNTILLNMKTQNDLKALEIEAIVKSAEKIEASNLLLAKVMTALVNNTESTTQNQNTALIYNDLLLGESIENNQNLKDLNKNIKAQTQAIIAQKIDLKVEGGMNANLNLDITPLAQSNAIIASGVENQIATNAKIIETLTKKNIDLDNKKENYEFLKDGLPSLKDSKGNIIKPRESQALKSAEDSILTKDKNNFDSQSNIIDTLSSVLNDEESKNSGTSSGFGDFELKDILGKILNVDLEKFDSEYASNLYQPKGANNGN